MLQYGNALAWAQGVSVADARIMALNPAGESQAEQVTMELSSVTCASDFPAI